MLGAHGNIITCKSRDGALISFSVMESTLALFFVSLDFLLRFVTCPTTGRSRQNEGWCLQEYLLLFDAVIKSLFRDKVLKLSS